MLKSNLAVLLAERGLKITRVANDTGISRTTLTGLTQNSSKMVQFETVDTLCQYLRIEPKDFFEYVPFSLSFSMDIDFSSPSSDEQESKKGHFWWSVDGFLNIKERDNKKTVNFDGTVERTTSLIDRQETVILDVNMRPEASDQATVDHYLSELSPAFLTDVKKRLTDEIAGEIDRIVMQADVPFVSAYRALKIQVKLTENNQISDFRLF